MYRIMKTDGTLLGTTEYLRYIKINPKTRVFVTATKDTAIGIAFKGNPYNIVGHNEIEGASTVIISETDAGAQLDTLNLSDSESNVHLAEVDEVAIDLFEANLVFEEINAEQDEAIIDIYEMMEATING